MTVLACHQPIFLPWPGFFAKALFADVTVLLDQVQFPLRSSWATRNRIKSKEGDLWLTVPVRRKGKGKQRFDEVELYDELPWRGKHLRAMHEAYSSAPYRHDYLPAVEAIYRKEHRRLADFNVDLIRFFFAVLKVPGRMELQSRIAVMETGDSLPPALCRHFNAATFCTLPSAEKFLHANAFTDSGVAVRRLRFQPPLYPQLWGDFRYNLSILDLLFTCGPRARDILFRACR